jgi:hypothetical protein
METLRSLTNCPSQACQPAKNIWRLTAQLFSPLSMWRQSLNLSLDDLFQLSKISPRLVCNLNFASRLSRPSLHVSSSITTTVFLYVWEISPNNYFACVRTKPYFANGAFVINFAVRILQECLVTSMPVFLHICAETPTLTKLSFNNVLKIEKLAWNVTNMRSRLRLCPSPHYRSTQLSPNYLGGGNGPAAQHKHL